MSRLLFAAARGARIEYLDCVTNTWGKALVIRTDTTAIQRIHPEDEHLAYGPISSALRDAAAAGATFSLVSNYGGMAREYLSDIEPNWCWMFSDEKSIFMLIIAEMLADSGL